MRRPSESAKARATNGKSGLATPPRPVVVSGEAPTSLAESPGTAKRRRKTASAETEGAESESTSSSGQEDSAPESASYGSDPEDEDPDDTTVDVTLDFFDPNESDFHGLKALFQNYLDGKEYEVSDLVDAVIAQKSVGTVVKTGDDEDPIGVSTVLSTAQHGHRQCLKDVRSYILQHCEDKKLSAMFKEAWDGAGIGLLLNERLMNCPPQLGPPLQQALFDEIEWATEDEPTQELRDSFKFERFITMSRVFAEPSLPQMEGKRSKKQKAAAAGPQLVYVKPEDEFYHAESSAAFSFATPKSEAKDDLQPRRLVMLLTKAQVGDARSRLDGVIGNAAAGGQA